MPADGRSADGDGDTGVGDDIPRREDGPLLTGEATYTDDIDEAGLRHMAVLRSPHPHAVVDEIDTSQAESIEGVEAVYTAADVAASGVPADVQPLFQGGLPRLELPRRPLLAEGRVRYEGEPVAVAVATERYLAYDAVDRIAVDYRERPAVTGPEAARSSGGPTVHEAVPDNVALTYELGDPDATDAAFEGAAQVTTLTLSNQRLAPTAIEPRAAVADSAADGRLTVRMTTQVPHVHRFLFAEALGLPEQQVRIVAPEVGGGFGSKIHHYPAETLAAWCSMQLGQPVKWQARRSGSFRADSQGRGHRAQAELAVDEDGTIVGLRSETVADIGAYISTISPVVPTYNYGLTQSGQYEIPAVNVSVTGVFTNRTPTDAYRGAGRPESAFLVERLVTKAACEFGVDPVTFRRDNFIPADGFPYAAPYEIAEGVPLMYDSGNYGEALDEALELVDYGTVRHEQARRRAGRADGAGPDADPDASTSYLGIGLSCYTEAVGLGPAMVGDQLGALTGMNDTALLRFHPSGTVTAFVGTSAHGQGHETSFAQVVADELGVPYDDIEVVEGDTDRAPYGLGTFNSRSAIMGGSSLVEAAEALVDDAREMAATRFGVPAADVTFEDGVFRAPTDDGDDAAAGQTADIQTIAREAYLGRNLPGTHGAGLEASAAFDPMGFSFPFGAHVAVVEVDGATGRVDVRRYVAVDDCGPRLNPRIVDGQVHGGVAQGIGQALYEEAAYDDDGRLRAGRLDEYAVPRATELPDIETGETVTPSPLNPLGVKGIGEGGTIAAPPAVVNAVVDALEPFDVDHLDMPLTPERVWTTMWGDGESSAGDPAAEGRSDGETATGNRGPDYDTDVTPGGGA